MSQALGLKTPQPQRYLYYLPDYIRRRAEIYSRMSEAKVAHRGGNPEADALGKSGYEAHLEGALGEVAAAAHFGGWPKWTLHYDGGYDFYGSDGAAYNAKAVRWAFRHDPILKVRPHLSPTPRYVLLVLSVELGAVELVGWATHADLFGAPGERLASVGGRRGFTEDTHWMRERDLKPLPEPSRRAELLRRGWSPLPASARVGVWRRPGPQGGWFTEERALEMEGL